MKKLILNLCRWALAALGVTGIISCDGDSDFLPAPEYGCPMMNFRVQGKVLSSETDKPVKGIAVIAIIDHHTYESQDTVWTADNGEFVCKDYASPSESVILKFTDVDGADNGGEFRTRKVEVPLTKQLEDGEDWNIGTYTAEDVAVELELLYRPKNNSLFMVNRQLIGIPYFKYTYFSAKCRKSLSLTVKHIEIIQILNL